MKLRPVHAVLSVLAILALAQLASRAAELDKTLYSCESYRTRQVYCAQVITPTCPWTLAGPLQTVNDGCAACFNPAAIGYTTGPCPNSNTTLPPPPPSEPPCVNGTSRPCQTPCTMPPGMGGCATVIDGIEWCTNDAYGPCQRIPPTPGTCQTTNDARCLPCLSSGGTWTLRYECLGGNCTPTHNPYYCECGRAAHLVGDRCQPLTAEDWCRQTGGTVTPTPCTNINGTCIGTACACPPPRLSTIRGCRDPRDDPICRIVSGNTTCITPRPPGNQTEFNRSVNNASLHVQVAVPGLTTAVAHVSNDRARAVIERNLARFQSKYRARYDTVDAIEVGTTVHVHAQKRATVLWVFTIRLDDLYVLDDDGTILAVRRNFWSRLLPGARTEPLT